MKFIRSKVGLIFASLIFFVLFSFAFLFATSNVVVEAAGENTTFTTVTYKTAGASVRLFEKDGSALADGKTGIRFHVIMDEEVYNANKTNPDFKTYTIIIPTYLLSGDLTYTTSNALILDTTDIWGIYPRDSAYRQSIAYVYGLPFSQYATDLTYCGAVSFDGGKTIAHYTETATRSMAYVAKSARDDVNAVLGDPTEEAKRVGALNDYIPQYNMVYKVGEQTTTEVVEYGNAPVKMPQGISIWKNNNGEKVDLSQKLFLNNKETSGQEIVLTAYANIKMTTSNSSATVGGHSVANNSSIEVKCGSYSLTTMANTDYYISGVKVNGSNIGAVSNYTLSVTGDMTIAVSASIITYNVTLNNEAGVTVTGEVSGTHNINSTCEFKLPQGFYKVTVDNAEISPASDGKYSFNVTANSTVKIVKLRDEETTKKLMQIIADHSVLSVSGDTLVSPSDTGKITIPQAVFDELKKYGYTTLTFDIYKPQKKELLYQKRIQDITNGVTIAQSPILKDSISGSVSLTASATLEGQYKSLGTWNGESIGVSWTLSNIRYS